MRGGNDDDVSRAEKNSGGGAALPAFLHRRLGGIINTLERRTSHDSPNQKISNYRCHLARLFTLIGERINQQAGREAAARNSETKLFETGVILPLIPHIGVAGITLDRRKDENNDEHETKRRRNPAAHEKPGMG